MNTAQPSTHTPTDISNDKRALVVPYLTLLPEDALQRRYPVREAVNTARWMLQAGGAWRLLPTNFPPCPSSTSTPSAGSQQADMSARVLSPYPSNELLGGIIDVYLRGDWVSDS